MYQHFQTIAASTHLPCILYNIPARTGREIAVETGNYLESAADVRSLVGTPQDEPRP